ncbi:ribosome-inactivating family protein [Nonomuraea sp. B12E4]|uniref:ribosome-inactivating family protein n=1 Tax=Nonomuraea sp. B12E4 TaxID=3153564 RepID=UPI00325F1C95
MALGDEDILKPQIFEANSQQKNYQRIINFLRERYRSWNGAGERFFRVDFVLEASKPPRHPTVRLYFQKDNLYLRGWAINRERRLVAAWDRSEEHALSLPHDEATWDKDLGWVALEYGTGSTQGELSKTVFFQKLQTLYYYILKAPRESGVDAKGRPQRQDAEQAFHLVARMTSEMARFDPYFKKMYDNWTRGLDQKVRPESRYCWGKDGAPDSYRMPPFEDIVHRWADCSRKAAGWSPELTFTVANTVVPVTTLMAKEILGNGAKKHA